MPKHRRSICLIGLLSGGCVVVPNLGGLGDDEVGDTVGDTTTDTVGDTTTDTTTGTEDSTTGTEDSTDAPPLDSDMDGSTDDVDNCPNTPNPNQLDFDGDGAGNACDLTSFTMAGGTLSTFAVVAAVNDNCVLAMDLAPTGGEVHLRFDDDAAVVGIEIASLSFADVPGQECKVSILTLDLSLSTLIMTNSGGDFPVEIAHNQAAHDAGVAVGETATPHPMATTAKLQAKLAMNPPMNIDLALAGALPTMTVEVTAAGQSLQLSFADQDSVIGAGSFMITDPVMIPVDFELRGLVGTIELAP